jgi:Ser/Thr protein kinase RdoA (MazF antagonist)
MITEATINEGCKRFGVDRVSADLTQGALNSVIFECTRAGVECFLKISGATASGIEGRIEALQHIQCFAEKSTDDIRFAKPMLSADGNLAESLDSGEVHATLIEKAPGVPHANEVPVGPDGQNEIFRMGRIGGRIHRFSQGLDKWRSLRGSDGGAPTDEEGGSCSDMRALYESLIQKCDDEDIVRCLHNLRVRMNELPVSREVYGFINSDMNWSNFAVSDDAWTIFDFSGVYGWFLTTVAGALFYMRKIDRDQWQGYWDAYRAGYEEECPVDPWWWRQILLFLEERWVGVFVMMYNNRHSPKMKNVDFSERREQILSGEPFIDFDFSVR